MVRIPSHRPPTHPGEMLLEDRRGITPSTALRLAKFFGTTPDLWMNLQLRWDLYHAQEAEEKDLWSWCCRARTFQRKLCS